MTKELKNKQALKQIFLDADYFQLTNNGLSIQNDPSYESCARAAHTLGIANKAIQFAIGDLLNYADVKFGELAAQLEHETGYTEGTLRNFKSTSKAFPPSRRRESIEYNYYRELQGLPEETQEGLLDRIEEGTIPLSQSDIRVIKRSVFNKEVKHLERYEHICNNTMTLCLDCGKIRED